MLDIGQIAAATTDLRAGAAEILDRFRSIVPYAAASISAWNPITDRHETIANASYPPEVVRHLDTWFVHHDEVYELMRNVDPEPLRWRDMPFDYRRLYSAREVFMPAGFDEGVTTCLYTPDGRYTGSMHVSTDSRRHPSDSAAHALVIMQQMLAGVTDILRPPTWLASSLGTEEGGAIVTPEARVVTLAGPAPGPHLISDGALPRAVAQTLCSGQVVTRFLWQDDAGHWHEVRLAPIPEGAVVTVAASRLPHELTPRELDVLTLVTAGCSNPQIAATLFLSTKTVAKHVEHLLAKLCCTTRAEAASRAINEGLLRRPVPSARA
ncbi:helix-turn-helix transcriptional regulator [Saccharopolyspora phatthalungensis]|uniref:DNA-binding CsgD family transcriptional regulator n=1 Tax=Saccharopolyspora phatthalungensis TaxID=664693 RepID=A0A840QKW7_9PSEU|nr:LuxR C-terminal-related transcriptional regulator [Saccharopolyspora phatthalungensis]MBB5159683.1 DNA-binding CsgD family transcriptional regulator [Saccharopolyspora phatthalungensis]